MQTMPSGHSQAVPVQGVEMFIATGPRTGMHQALTAESQSSCIWEFAHKHRAVNEDMN